MNDLYDMNKKATHTDSNSDGERSTLVSARDKVAYGIRVTADGLDSRSTREAGDAPMAEWERATADRLHSWSESLSQWDIEAAEAKLRSTITRRPGVSLLAAAAVGLCIGLCLRKS